MSFSAVVLDHIANPRNQGPLKGCNATGQMGQRDAGPFVIIYLVVSGAHILRAGFECNANVGAIASGSVLTCWLNGKSVLEAQTMTQQKLTGLLGGLPLGMRHYPGIAVAALDAALAALVPTGDTRQ